MKRFLGGWIRIPSAILLIALAAAATSIPRLSFEELTDHSEIIVSGRIVRSWCDWDTDHRFIWTHYELRISAAHKGSPPQTVVVSEPGGVLGDRGMSIADAVSYQPGEQVVVFLERMPNGYLRTTGWGQGKYTLDTAGRLRAGASLRGSDLIRTTTAGTPLQTLDGMSVARLHARIRFRLQSQQQRRAK
jgi:hypothetical protein